MAGIGDFHKKIKEMITKLLDPIEKKTTQALSYVGEVKYIPRVMIEIRTTQNNVKGNKSHTYFYALGRYHQEITQLI
ncbi:MAG: hypothetical protein ABI045_06150 [Flavobacteriales bacterium]